MTQDEIASRYDLAQKLARGAGEIAGVFFRKPTALNVQEKGLHDLVTEADLGIDRYLTDELRRAFPCDSIVTEESGGEWTDSVWVIDPLDGTQNFARGIGHFAVSIAFHHAGRTEVGVVYNPVSGEMFAARRGFGAYCNDEPIAVRQTALPREAVIDAGYSTQWPVGDYLALLSRLTGASYGFLQNGSAAMGLAHVASGRIDGYCELFLNSWDVLAGVLLVQEAGGWTSDFTADDGLLRGNAILACAPLLRGSLQAVTEIGRTDQPETIAAAGSP
ncbi:inositol monophosphatase [Rhizobium sp. KVB221]|uniref:Inositol-1-monophosphatase n=1 Tax=Rhizobium setariae TaxID=2801340 RepID=A0A937CRH1_9HYPH|nr:inositol monophosphatase family protein [Rhizobium setariae]MBL0375473.1 inositol monophosphatase [Rhizobium setariae]